MKGCIFCRIVQKEIPAKVAGETDQALAFYDVNPQAPIHILIIPKMHCSSIMDEQAPGVVGELAKLAQQLARELKIEPNGFRFVANFGPDAGQSVDHLHFHFLAKRKLAWPPG